ncbi:MAG: 3-hydroxyacyl-CoA dehydrogenase [Robiginitomaculum sp.]|nr:MAG: 3-hydroxyacyl-CoA dehydrogenase [Robiginitomaculum sp.]
MKIKGQTAIVFGGASGLGKACATALLDAGANVAIIDINEEQGGETACQNDALFIKASVAEADEVACSLDRVAQHFGAPARIILNAAGVAAREGRIASPKAPASLTMFKKISSVNVSGAFNVISQTAHAMMSLDPEEGGERGIIVSIASIAGEDGPVGSFAYASTKAAVIGMTLPAARDLAPFGIRVMCLSPGAFDTPMLRSMGEKDLSAALRLIPFPGRAGDPAELGRFFCHVIETPLLNGTNIRVDAAARLALI